MPVAVDARRVPLRDTSPGLDLRPPRVRAVALDLPDSVLSGERALLTDDERAHADRGTARVTRRRIALRAGLRRLAGAVLAMPPAAVPLHIGTHGRPELDVPGVDVSCSYGGALGLVVVAFASRVGVDVEPVAPWRDEILSEGWLSLTERRALSSLDPTQRAVAATRCWTRKEALLKGAGSGLTDSLDELEVGIGEAPVHLSGWWVCPVPAVAGHVATIAVRPLPSSPATAGPRHGGVLSQEWSAGGHRRA